jgi:hypothetical protein
MLPASMTAGPGTMGADAMHDVVKQGMLPLVTRRDPAARQAISGGWVNPVGATAGACSQEVITTTSGPPVRLPIA